MSFEIRNAREKDLPRLVEVFRTSRQQLLPFLPILHSREKDYGHLKDLLQRGDVRVGGVTDGVDGFLVRIERWIAHLYVHPDAIGRGLGRALLDDAKARSSKLELWCFEANHRARSFYEAHGFVLVDQTEGDNEEGLPDRLYRWARQRV